MSATTELPKYRCHKEVWALKIARVTMPNASGGSTLEFDNPIYGAIEKPREWDQKHLPQPGGYYVVYADGYASYSPGDVFEDGYTLIEQP